MRHPFYAIFVAVLMVVAASGQTLPREFLIKLKYTKLDLPHSVSSTCMVVFRDNRFHMERNEEWPGSESRVFEDWLPDGNIKSLLSIIESRELKTLKAVETGRFKVAQGEIVRVTIPRADATQKLVFIGLEGSVTQNPKPLPASLGPLIEWFQAAISVVDQRKIRPLKNVKPLNCWMGSPEDRPAINR